MSDDTTEDEADEVADFVEPYLYYDTTIEATTWLDLEQELCQMVDEMRTEFESLQACLEALYETGKIPSRSSVRKREDRS